MPTIMMGLAQLIRMRQGDVAVSSLVAHAHAEYIPRRRRGGCQVNIGTPPRPFRAQRALKWWCLTAGGANQQHLGSLASGVC